MVAKKKSRVHKKGLLYTSGAQEYLRTQHRRYQDTCENYHKDNNLEQNSCYYLGIFYETIKNNRLSAGRSFEVGCARDKNGPSCFKLGEYYRDGQGNFKRDSEKAAEAFDKSCKYGHGEGCYQSGLSFTPWNGGSLVKWRVAEQKFMRGCALNHGESCDALGVMYRRGLIPADKKLIFAKSYNSAWELFSTQSDMIDDGVGKSNLAFLLKQREYLMEQCRKVLGIIGSEEESQAEISQDYYTPKISRTDAIDLSFGCLNGTVRNTELCHIMSDWMHPRNPDMGSLMYDQNCRVGSSQSCFKLGQIRLKGLPALPKDHEKAALAFEMACESGNVKGCFQAGVMRSSNKFNCQKQGEVAESCLIKGCAANDENSCVQLSALYRQKNHQNKFHQTSPWLGFLENRFQVHSAEKIACNFGKFEECAKLADLCKKKLKTGNKL